MLRFTCYDVTVFVTRVSDFQKCLLKICHEVFSFLFVFALTEISLTACGVTYTYCTRLGNCHFSTVAVFSCPASLHTGAVGQCHVSSVFFSFSSGRSIENDHICRPCVWFLFTGSHGSFSEV